MLAVRWECLECGMFLFGIKGAGDEAIAPAAQKLENEVGAGTLDDVNGLQIVGWAVAFAEEVGKCPACRGC